MKASWKFQTTSDTQKEIPMAMNASESAIEQCIEECLQCVRWCSACVEESLTHDPSAMAECIRLCHECAPICSACVTLLAGNSRVEYQLCALCADICEACAAECGKYPSMETSRRCPKTRREVAGTRPAGKVA